VFELIDIAGFNPASASDSGKLKAQTMMKHIIAIIRNEKITKNPANDHTQVYRHSQDI